MHMSDSIAVMNHGRIEQYDTAHHLYRRPSSRFVADFIGKSNIFAGTVTETAAGSEFATEEFRLRLAATEDSVRTGGNAELVIRPEDIRLCPASQGRAVAGDVVLSGSVATSTYSGDRALYSITLQGGRVMLTYGSARDGALGPGAPVQIAFDARDGILLS